MILLDNVVSLVVLIQLIKVIKYLFAVLQKVWIHSLVPLQETRGRWNATHQQRV